MTSHDSPGRGWTGTVFTTTVLAVVLAVLAYAMSGHRTPRLSGDGARPGSVMAESETPGRGLAR
jgi:hypothetical protein